jgi:hypothetical protein
MSGIVTGAVKTTLRLEGLCVLIVSLIAYSQFGSGWGIFALCFLLPDVSFLGYLAGARIGAMAYNAAHSYIGAVLALAASFLFPAYVPFSIAIIWCAHIGFDRALGYGLKYQQGFGYTHLGLIGRGAKTDSTASIN